MAASTSSGFHAYSSWGRKRKVNIITPSSPNYTNILLPLTPVQIFNGSATGTVDTATYPEFAAAIPSFITNPDITVNGTKASFSTENERYLLVFQDSLPTLSKYSVQIWGFSYALPRWSPLYDVHGVELRQYNTNNVQLAKIYEIAGVDKILFVEYIQASFGGRAANRLFDKNAVDTDHLSAGVCTF